jgi:AraC-like DNA-binding protein
MPAVAEMRHVMASKTLAVNNVVPIDARQAELAERVARSVAGDGLHRTAFAPLAFGRASEIGQPLPDVYTPSLCIVVQGRKRVLVGTESFHSDAFNYLIVSVTLPALNQILDASPERPYLCLRIDIDMREVGRLLLEMEAAQPADAATGKCLYVARMSSDLVDVVLRLVRLLDAPSDLPVLGPLALREIWYRLLRGEMGHRLRELAQVEGPVQRINRAIELLQRNYGKPLHIEELAEISNMSASAFHARFKTVTSMSPLQFLKRLRLHEARRLMMNEGSEVAAAAYRVGYESPSQFSREYRRLFGAPPRQEIAVLRNSVSTRAVRATPIADGG